MRLAVPYAVTGDDDIELSAHRPGERSADFAPRSACDKTEPDPAAFQSDQQAAQDGIHRDTARQPAESPLFVPEQRPDGAGGRLGRMRQERPGGYDPRLPFPLVNRSASHTQSQGLQCLLPRLGVKAHGVNEDAVQIKTDGWRTNDRRFQMKVLR